MNATTSTAAITPKAITHPGVAGGAPRGGSVFISSFGITTSILLGKEDLVHPDAEQLGECKRELE